MMLAHKIALDPTDKQRSYFVRASGTARFAYNWALAEWKRQHAVGGKPSEVSLRRQLNSVKGEQYPWMFDVTKCAAQEAIIDLGTAFRTFLTLRKILNDWPQALRCQPVERHALARFARAA
jgi:putative transposase